MDLPRSGSMLGLYFRPSFSCFEAALASAFGTVPRWISVVVPTRRGKGSLFCSMTSHFVDGMVSSLPFADLVSFQQLPIVCQLLATMDVVHGLRRRSTLPHMQVDGNGCGWKQVGSVLLKP